MRVELLIEEPKWEAIELVGLADDAARQVVAVLGLEAGHEVSLLACSDVRIAELNAAFREKPAPTNVLSWPNVDLVTKVDGEKPEVGAADAELGDIAIAYETCAKEAEAQGKPFDDHVTHLLTHGILHLLGFDHQRPKDAELMEGIETRVLAKLGISDPYGV